MKIRVLVKPCAREDKLKKLDSGHFSLWIKAKPEAGKANQAAKGLLSRHFKVPKSCVKLLRGHTCRWKTFEVISSHCIA